MFISAESATVADKILNNLTDVFEYAVNYAVLFIELVGTIVLLFSVAVAVVNLCKKEPHVRLRLAEGIALALEFKMGGELLRTVLVREWNELLILGAIILLRAAITFLIQWEIKLEQKRGMDIKPLFPLKKKVSENKEKSDVKDNKAE